jgi:hypothetical protein
MSAVITSSRWLSKSPTASSPSSHELTLNEHCLLRCGPHQVSALGHYEKWALGLGRSALRPDADVRDSHLKLQRSLFLRKNSLFHLLGNSTANRLPVLGTNVRDGSHINEIHCIFPKIREFGHRRHVRRSLPAQPPSLRFSGSLPTLLNECGRSAEIRHRMRCKQRPPSPLMDRWKG